MIAKPVSHAEIVASVRGSWDDLATYDNQDQCSPNAEGKCHPPEYECVNWVEGEYGCGCKVQGRRMAELTMESMEWTPTLLDHYWEHGIEGPGMEFLERSKFVWSYE